MPIPDAVYRMTYGGGALLPNGALVVKCGKIVGIGQELGEFRGGIDAGATQQAWSLDISARVPTAHPIATGLKAGPAGSTIQFKLKGPPPIPREVYVIDLAGHRGEVTLDLFETLLAPEAPPIKPHPDAFPDGIYRLASAGIGYLTQTIVIMNGGQLLGLGEVGGQYRGRYVFDPIRKLTAFTGQARLPPGVPLIVGGAVGPDWMTASLASEAKFNGGKTRFSFSLAGRAIDSELTFQHPLPQ